MSDQLRSCDVCGNKDVELTRDKYNNLLCPEHKSISLDSCDVCGKKEGIVELSRDEYNNLVCPDCKEALKNS
ncbi:MAG: hypothetical protein ACOCQR_01960 [bacterium]